ncbi:MAG: hypothetical protein CM15mP117_21230 [Alphaproteobacteria bacterium]|nr:MAG: hypothetical protein CM15mP117_21230 [Alphaproteobacteria bacterium]
MNLHMLAQRPEAQLARDARVYADRLLVLPMCLGGHTKTKEEFTAGIKITGIFAKIHI